MFCLHKRLADKYRTDTEYLKKQHFLMFLDTAFDNNYFIFRDKRKSFSVVLLSTSSVCRSRLLMPINGTFRFKTFSTLFRILDQAIHPSGLGQYALIRLKHPWSTRRLSAVWHPHRRDATRHLVRLKYKILP